jgi:hypothetical protein
MHANTASKPGLRINDLTLVNAYTRAIFLARLGESCYGYGASMPFFDRVPVPPELERNRSPRRWLAWFAIPLATGFAWLGQAGRKDGGLDDDGRSLFIWIGLLAGAACILLSSPRQRSLKWVLLLLYPIVMFPVLAAIDLAINGFGPLPFTF